MRKDCLGFSQPHSEADTTGSLAELVREWELISGESSFSLSCRSGFFFAGTLSKLRFGASMMTITCPCLSADAIANATGRRIEPK